MRAKGMHRPQAVAIRAETSRYGQDNETRRALPHFAERFASSEPLRRECRRDTT
jgi:hypothetical protein